MSFDPRQKTTGRKIQQIARSLSKHGYEMKAANLYGKVFARISKKGMRELQQAIEDFLSIQPLATADPHRVIKKAVKRFILWNVQRVKALTVEVNDGIHVCLSTKDDYGSYRYQFKVNL